MKNNSAYGIIGLFVAGMIGIGTLLLRQQDREASAPVPQSAQTEILRPQSDPAQFAIGDSRPAATPAAQSSPAPALLKKAPRLPLWPRITVLSSGGYCQFQGRSNMANGTGMMQGFPKVRW